VTVLLQGAELTVTHTIRHLIIHGRVQGVGFRVWAASAAQRRGLVGWVRNRKDGTVEAVFAGPAYEVGAMASECRSGPPGAEVVRVVEAEGGERELRLSGSVKDFVSLPTV
jgi:acylphosphatase